jgi:photosystem II stability/assembly factor-like uncharacterized protein
MKHLSGWVVSRIIPAGGGARRWRTTAGIILVSAVLLAPSAADAYASSWATEAVPGTMSNDDIDGGVSCVDSTPTPPALPTTRCVAVGEHDANGNAAAYAGTSGAIAGPETITWASSTIGGSVDGLKAVSCASTTVCTAVGYTGAIARSTDGGASWTAQTATPASTEHLDGVSCYSSASCVAVGGDAAGIILLTTNSGTTWTKLSGVPTVQTLADVSCPSASLCVATAFGGGILRSTNGGSSWSKDVTPSGFVFDLLGVSCVVSASTYCVAVDNNASVKRWTSAGWTTVFTSTDNLNSVSCSGSSCYAVGMRGLFLTSSNSGVGWTSQTAPTTTDMYGVSCTPSRCRAGGTKGTYGTSNYGGGAIDRI